MGWLYLTLYFKVNIITCNLQLTYCVHSLYGKGLLAKVLHHATVTHTVVIIQDVYHIFRHANRVPE